MTGMSVMVVTIMLGVGIFTAFVWAAVAVWLDCRKVDRIKRDRHTTDDDRSITHWL